MPAPLWTAALQGSVLLALGLWLAPRVMRHHLDGPDPELAAWARQLSQRVQTLTRTRHHAVDTAAAELRRIERDLHDGAQARLVALGMSLQLDTPLHTVLDLDLPGEAELPVASAVYFSVAEALATVAKHAAARTVRISLSHDAGMLRAQLTDDGAGGTDPALGSGLAGVERRLASFDGILAVSSPPGGPTIVVIEVPCALSSPKISSC